ncbi:hypothetical protein ACFWP3_14145 [Streptomyces sp. NPDC058525]|uniref:hypothetical protein n=1 Tax=Streptomyces sp. NPDC058525 TaxID=3346538 RepID=UPI003662B926
MAAWIQIRNQIDWTSAAGEVPASVEPIVDGLTTWCGKRAVPRNSIEAGDCSRRWEQELTACRNTPSVQPLRTRQPTVPPADPTPAEPLRAQTPAALPGRGNTDVASSRVRVRKKATMR